MNGLDPDPNRIAVWVYEITLLDVRDPLYAHPLRVEGRSTENPDHAKRRALEAAELLTASYARIATEPT